MRKAAVVIGVDKTGQLTPLQSAASGAQRFADWLASEGFAVHCLTDAKTPVTCAAIEYAIESFVTVPARYHLLLVYFSGHGYWQARTDQWLLSGAPVKPREAVNLVAAMDRAKYSGIPNVVFVSDACRTIPTSRAGAMIDGSGIFPSYDEITNASKIDYFKATSEALPAFEGLIGGQPQSLLTAALMSAFEEPEAHMVREVRDGNDVVQVVPNRRLEDFLQRKVDALLATIDTALTQQLETNVPSSDDVYLARVRHRLVAGATPPVPPAPAPASAAPVQPARVEPAPVEPAPVAVPDAGRDAASAVTRALSSRGFAAGNDLAALYVEDTTTERELQTRMPEPAIASFESEMGFVVLGAGVARADVADDTGEAFVVVRGGGDNGPGIVRVNATRPVSVVLEFDTGRLAVLAGLPGFVSHVTVGAEGIDNVSYVPSSNHWRFEGYAQRRAEIDRLRAMVALAVDRNRFRIGSNREANALAERIRTEKGVDPTLGLYAAVAYAGAGNDERIATLVEYMRSDLEADLLDVRLLAGRAVGGDLFVNVRPVPIVPFCPMLTQSWHLLTSPRAVPAAALAEWPDIRERWSELRPYLCSSLWTTFEPDAASALHVMLPGNVYA